MAFIGISSTIICCLPTLKRQQSKRCIEERLELMNEALEKAEERVMRLQERHDRLVTQICSYYMCYKELDHAVLGARMALHEELEFVASLRKMQLLLLTSFFDNKKIQILNKNSSLLRALAVVAVGSGTFYANYHSNPNSRLHVSISIPRFAARDDLSLPWTLPLFSLGPVATDVENNQYPLHSYKAAASPSADTDSYASTDSTAHPSRYMTRDTIANAAAKVSPAVVNLSVPQGIYGLTMGKSIGSGTIIDSDGTILTCAHVVVDFQGMRASSKGKVEVTLQDGRTFEGKVLNADLHSDIAIVKINTKLPLPSAKLGSSSKLRPGEWVVAMGCPLSLQNTVTAGIISCVDRKSSDLGLGGMRREYLQTDCAINAGNSGGPLVNMDGEVVGVNNMKVLIADGLSFAVPIDSVSKIIDHFNKKGRVVRPWLGLKMIDLNEMILPQLRERDPTFPNVERGVLVPMVSTCLFRPQEFACSYLFFHLVVASAVSYQLSATQLGGYWVECVVDGVLGHDVRLYFGCIKLSLFHVLASVTPGSPADRAGFRPGDVVVEFDGKLVGSIKEIIDIMDDKVGKRLKVVVKRANNVVATLTVVPEEANPDM
ncbi:hypothetical protein KSS87_017932 [Heliosperma pusillum]|nr:hypothetical protein KSS87_017932 [Heliosperma pusillum]